MEFQHIRSATSIIKYAGVRILVDPWFAPEGSLPPMGASLGVPDFGDPRPYPLSSLPETPEEIIAKTDIVIATHLHGDHFDDIAAKLIKEKNILIFAQDDVDAEELKTKYGITNIQILDLKKPIQYKELTIQRIECDHGAEVIYQKFPFRRTTSGFVLKSPKEPKTVYFAGDTLYCKPYTDAIQKYKPDVIVINGCRATTPLGPLLMSLEDIAQTHKDIPSAKLVIVHLDTVPHATVFSSDVKKFVSDEKLEGTILVPANGEKIIL